MIDDFKKLSLPDNHYLKIAENVNRQQKVD